MSQVKLMRELLGETNWASLGLVRKGLVTKVNLERLIQPIRKWTHSILSHKFYWIGKQFRKQRNFEDDSDIQWLQQLDSDQQRDLTSPAAVLVRGYEGQVPLQLPWGTICWPGHPHLSWLCRERPVASYLTLSDCEWSDLYVCPSSQPRNSEGKHHLQHPSTSCKKCSIFGGAPIPSSWMLFWEKHALPMTVRGCAPEDIFGRSWLLPDWALLFMRSCVPRTCEPERQAS